jgi:hypothetical protein
MVPRNRRNIRKVWMRTWCISAEIINSPFYQGPRRNRGPTCGVLCEMGDFTCKTVVQNIQRSLEANLERPGSWTAMCRKRHCASACGETIQETGVCLARYNAWELDLRTLSQGFYNYPQWAGFYEQNNENFYKRFLSTNASCVSVFSGDMHG